MTRTFGYVEDAGKIDNLRKVVELFYFDTSTNKELRFLILPKKVKTKDGREGFINVLSKAPIKISYRFLVGTGFSPRSSARCNGIIQALIPGQRRPFLTDWAADNYLRWAHVFGFIKYDRQNDTFAITEEGIKYANSKLNSSEEKELLSIALLKYPLVVRILRLLADGEIKSKFDLGSMLGFTDEEGFTSFPKSIFIQAINTSELHERSKIRQNWEGTSDKYARMICGWLMDSRLKWVAKITNHKIHTTVGGKEYSSEIAQSYQITGEGLKALRRAEGINIQRKIPRIVNWEMLSTKTINPAYIRNRRANILKQIKTSKTIEEIQKELSNLGINENVETLEDDIKGLIGIGLNIKRSGEGYILTDDIERLDIPILMPEDKTKDSITQIIDDTRAKLKHISHNYLVLIEMSFNNKDSLLFEAKTVDLLRREANFLGEHLGGGDKPDGIIYTERLEENFGVIIDNKSYPKGFNISASERDKMMRYVNENIERPKHHVTRWWEKFPKNIKLYFFMFISGRFTGTFKEQLDRISVSTDNTKGAAISSSKLLILCDQIKGKKLTLEQCKDKFACLDEISLEYLN